MSKFSRVLRISAGLLTLLVSLPEFIAQTIGVVVNIGPVTFGLIQKMEASGLGTIYFKGPIWYAFLLRGGVYLMAYVFVVFGALSLFLGN